MTLKKNAPDAALKTTPKGQKSKTKPNLLLFAVYGIILFCSVMVVLENLAGH